MGEPAVKRRLKGIYSQQDLSPDFTGLPGESDQTWKELINAAWDMTIAEVAFNDLRHPLSRVPSSLQTLSKTIEGVEEEETLRIIEDEIHTGIRHFTEIFENIVEAKNRMEEVAHQVWKRRQILKADKKNR